MRTTALRRQQQVVRNTALEPPQFAEQSSMRPGSCITLTFDDNVENNLHAYRRSNKGSRLSRMACDTVPYCTVG